MSVLLDDYGAFLRVRGQKFYIDNQENSASVPFHKIRRAVLSSGNGVSTSALFWLAQYGVETAIVSKTGRLVATIVPAMADARAETRLKQYEAYFSNKGVGIAQVFARKRVESEISFMEKFDMNTSRLEEWLPRINFEGDRVDEVRVHIQALEGKCTQEYFKLFPDFLKTKNRYKRGAQDPLNNLMKLGYEVLKRRVHVAVSAAHLRARIRSVTLALCKK